MIGGDPSIPESARAGKKRRQRAFPALGLGESRRRKTRPSRYRAWDWCEGGRRLLARWRADRAIELCGATNPGPSVCILLDRLREVLGRPPWGLGSVWADVPAWRRVGGKTPPSHMGHRSDPGESRFLSRQESRPCVPGDKTQGVLSIGRAGWLLVLPRRVAARIGPAPQGSGSRNRKWCAAADGAATSTRLGVSKALW